MAKPILATRAVAFIRRVDDISSMLIYAGYRCKDEKCYGHNIHSDVQIKYSEGFWHNGEYTIDAVLPELKCEYCGKPINALSVRLWLNTPEGTIHEKTKCVAQR